jgi:hypothetical protein
MSTTQPETIQPQGILVDIVLSAWRAKVVAEVAALNVADVLHEHGPATAAVPGGWNRIANTGS